ncbi:MAG: hypothetical protein IBJ03_01465 [Gemmatimonadaceae bacterium]|nr:hypothetical protein [Gemmatimonadaceae bacterium]
MSSFLARSRRVLWLLRTLPPSGAVWVVRRLLESPASRRHRLDEALSHADGRLVFVCHGNIMRSAFASEVARAASPLYSDFILSAGTHASDGSPAEQTAAAVARQFGVDLEAHRSSPLASLELTDRDLVVCMDRFNEAHVLMHLGHGGRVFLVGDIATDETGNEAIVARVSREIADPYGKGETVTQTAFRGVRSIGELWGKRYSAARGAIR